MKNPATEGGAVLLGGEHPLPNRNRPILQATPLMALRLEALLFGRREVTR